MQISHAGDIAFAQLMQTDGLFRQFNQFITSVIDPGLQQATTFEANLYGSGMDSIHRAWWSNSTRARFDISKGQLRNPWGGAHNTRNVVMSARTSFERFVQSVESAVATQNVLSKLNAAVGFVGSFPVRPEVWYSVIKAPPARYLDAPTTDFHSVAIGFTSGDPSVEPIWCGFTVAD